MKGKIFIPDGMKCYPSTHVLVIEADDWNVKFVFIDEQEVGKERNMPRKRFDVLYVAKDSNANI